MAKAGAMGGWKSYEGIVVIKLAGKATMASESAHHVADESPDPKGGDLMRSPEPM
jgi:hypothetical protein